MDGPYNEWRRLSYEETVALRELENEAQTQLITGGFRYSPVSRQHVR